MFNSIHVFRPYTIESSDICIGDNGNASDSDDLVFHFVNHFRIFHNQFQF